MPRKRKRISDEAKQQIREVFGNKGLDVAEDTVQKVVNEMLLPVAHILVNDTKTPFDNIALTIVENFLDRVIDMIDGEDG